MRTHPDDMVVDMTVRAEFAARFTAAILSNQQFLIATLKAGDPEAEAGTTVAREGVSMADALILELNKQS